jgi:hypothetical protein
MALAPAVRAPATVVALSPVTVTQRVQLGGLPVTAAMFGAFAGNIAAVVGNHVSGDPSHYTACRNPGAIASGTLGSTEKS